MAILEDKIINENEEEVSIYIEVDNETLEETSIYNDDRQTRGSRIPLEDAQQAMSKAMTLIRTNAELIAHTIKEIPEKARPSSWEVVLSIKLSAGIAMLAQASAESQLQVTLKWDKDK